MIVGAFGDPTKIVAAIETGNAEDDRGGHPPADRDARRGHPADLHRPGRRDRLPQRRVQHRRRGPVHHGRDGRDGRRPRPQGHRPPRSCSSRSRVGTLTGAAWGFIPGFLKARTGAHEVITTIMLNYVASQLVLFGLRSDFLRQPGNTRRSPRSCRRRARPAVHLRPAGHPPALGLHRRPADGGDRLVVHVQDDQGLRAPGRRAST